MGELKITSGEFRGRKIKTPGDKTHPMGERERLALFNMLAGEISGATILDAYAGSGALGIEALSRGAKKVVFVDNSRAAIRTINENCILLGVLKEKTAFCCKPVADFCGGNAQAQNAKDSPRITAEPEAFDLILADPPYDNFDAPGIRELAHCLRPGGILVLSHPGEAPEIPGLMLEKTRSYAAANISVYQKGPK